MMSAFRNLRQEALALKHYVGPYAALNSVCFVVDAALVFVLTHTTNLYYLLAVVISFLMSSACLFIGARYLVFIETETTLFRSFVSFCQVVCIKLVLASLYIFTLVELAGFSPFIARIISGGIEAITAFLLDYFRTFAMHRVRGQ